MTTRRLKLAAILLALYTPAWAARPASAQTDRQTAAAKFDEFGDVYPTDAAARLDNFANELQANPAARGFIVVYRSHRDLPGISGRHLGWMRAYLINSRGLAAERVVGVDGGTASCLVHEFWVVPVGKVPQRRDDAYSRDIEDIEAARKFDEYHFAIPEDQLVSYSSEYEGGLESFAQALRKEPRSLAYIIAYDGYKVVSSEEGEGRRRKVSRAVDADPTGTAWRELRQNRAALARQHGIAASRVKLVRGGYRRWRHIEFWIVPPGAHAPVPTPNAFPKGRR